jgi:hypothetical protein
MARGGEAATNQLKSLSNSLCRQSRKIQRIQAESRTSRSGLKLVRFPRSLAAFTLITRTAPCLRQLPYLRCRLLARLKLVRFPARSPLPIAALPSMSLSQKAPFPRSRRVLCRFSQKLHSTSRFCPSMSLASPRLRSLAPTLAALPSMSLIPSAPLKLARCPLLLAASLAPLPSMSLIPVAPFASGRRNK